MDQQFQNSQIQIHVPSNVSLHVAYHTVIGYCYKNNWLTELTNIFHLSPVICTSISRCNKHFFHLWRLCQFPCQCTFPSTASNQQYFSRCHDPLLNNTQQNSTINNKIYIHIFILLHIIFSSIWFWHLFLTFLSLQDQTAILLPVLTVTDILRDEVIFSNTAYRIK